MATKPESVPVGKLGRIVALFGAFVARVFIIFGGALPYYGQYHEIDRTNNPHGFSIYVSMAIIFSCCMKTCYWFFAPYDFPLFLQNFVMITTMLFMLALRVRVLNRLREIPDEEQRHFLDMDLSRFWDYTNLLSYIQAATCVTLLTTFILVFLGWFPGVIAGIGAIATCFDVATTTPQFYNNYKNRTTFGMSKSMVIIWVIADIGKLAYAVINTVPVTFQIGICIQLCIDISIFGQIFYYGSAPPDHSHDS